MKVQLIVVQGKPEGKVIPINRDRFIIGRAPECDLRPNSEEVSRTHAEFTLSAHGVMLRDLGSRNGTLVNNKAANEPVALRNGDLVQIAKLTFAVIIEGAPGEVGAKSPVAGPAVAAQKASLDEPSNAEIDSWLVTDPSGQTPDRPSGIYGGDTLTIQAYKTAATTVAPAPKSAAPAPAPAPAAAAPVAQAAPAAAPPPAAPVAPPAPAAAAAPAAPVSAAPPMTPPAPEPVAAAPETPAPTPAPAPVVESVAPPQPPPAPQPVQATAHPFESALDNIEHLPEGEGDLDAERNDDDGDPDAEDSEGEEGSPAEFIDESNPFYAAKKAKQAAEAPTAKKDDYKDTSDAASDILKKMMDRRRASRT